jgi:hypothetical protein
LYVDSTNPSAQKLSGFVFMDNIGWANAD